MSQVDLSRHTETIYCTGGRGEVTDCAAHFPIGSPGRNAGVPGVPVKCLQCVVWVLPTSASTSVASTPVFTYCVRALGCRVIQVVDNDNEVSV